MLAGLKAFFAKLDGEAHELDQEAIADGKQALADVEAQVSAFAPSLAEFETGLKALVADAEPGLKTGAETLLAKLLADFAPLVETAAKSL